MAIPNLRSERELLVQVNDYYNAVEKIMLTRADWRQELKDLNAKDKRRRSL